MGRVTKASAITNGQVAIISWRVDKKIDGCLGFEIVRVYKKTGERRNLASWVPFKGQSNPKWQPENTDVWPVQRLMWRDLTLRQRRDKESLREKNVTVFYEIRPVGASDGSGELVPMPKKHPYKGKPIKLQYLGKAVRTNELLISNSFGNIDCAFTNGILSTQFLAHVLRGTTDSQRAKNLDKAMKTVDGKLRKYLAGDVLPLIKRFFAQSGNRFNQALYELEDEELIKMLAKLKSRNELILANTSQNTKGEWDAENHPCRGKLKKAGTILTDRMFSNTAHIGHNKFSVLKKNGKPKEVLTGSTNWTHTGLCAQSNNAMVIRSSELARQYLAYWDALLNDTKEFAKPKPWSAKTNNKQSQELRDFNKKGNEEIVLKDKTRIKLWCSPNTKQTTKPSGDSPPVPPDLAQVFELMSKAKKLILFAVFMPSQAAKGDVVAKAIELGKHKKNLMVYGCLSDPTAMPNYVPKPTKGKDNRKPEQKQPHIFDSENVHLARATALELKDVVGDFEKEILKPQGAHAIIHDKIIVVDPLDKHGFVVMGSHNLGLKASYANDENMLIIRDNPGLIQAYAVHVLDLYDHYRFRARQAMGAASPKTAAKHRFNGFLSLTDDWMDGWLAPARSGLSNYLAEG